jgi:predicted  nucleic acid-binding Zn-ribbon protein
MSLDEERGVSNLGEKLREGVLNLWKEVGSLGKVADHHGGEIEELKRRLAALEREIHGLKVSRGRANAKNVKLQGVLSESEKKLSEIKAVLN